MYSSPLKPRVDDLQGFPVYDEPVVASHTIDSALSRALKRTTRQNSFQNPKLLRRASPSTFVRSELLRRFIRSTFSVPSFSVQPSFVPIQIRSSSSTLEFQASDSFSDFNLQICSPKIRQPSASIFKIQGGVTHNTLDDIHNHWKKHSAVSFSEAEKGGFKTYVMEIKGNRVYSKLKYESGVHRVQRVPLTETQGRLHTSTATVAIMPEVEEIDAKLCESAAASLEGKILLASFTKIIVYLSYEKQLMCIFFVFCIIV
ncbi:hypothetical protein P8452_51284 [Trifolium repens]|nr:hypothetical protein P8452_51284 [Trifolium repens]